MQWGNLWRQMQVAPLQQDDFPDPMPGNLMNPAYNYGYTNGLGGAQQGVQDHARTLQMVQQMGVPAGPQMRFQPDAPINFGGNVNWYGPGEHPSDFEESYRSWQHILSSMGLPSLPNNMPGLR